jgi:hypothetical protein
VDPGPVVAVEVSPCADNGRETYVTTPEAASFWTTYHRYESGEAQAVTDHEGSTARTLALIRAMETATELGVPLIYRDRSRVVDLSPVPSERGPVPGAFTVELGTCDPPEHAFAGCGEAETVLAVDHFTRLTRAVALARLVTSNHLTVVEALAVAVMHGHEPTSMVPNAAHVADHVVTDWRVGVFRLDAGDGHVEWLVGGHEGQ